MPDIAIPLADELRFLGLQCEAQARGPHRDQDREFLSTLIARLFDLAPHFSMPFVERVLPSANLPGANLPALLRTAARDLSGLADDLDRQEAGRAA